MRAAKSGWPRVLTALIDNNIRAALEIDAGNYRYTTIPIRFLFDSNTRQSASREPKNGLFRSELHTIRVFPRSVPDMF